MGGQGVKERERMQREKERGGEAKVRMGRKDKERGEMSPWYERYYFLAWQDSQLFR
jgi:hypothetical protein